jgi:hypothetical protein
MLAQVLPPQSDASAGNPGRDVGNKYGRGAYHDLRAGEFTESGNDAVHEFPAARPIAMHLPVPSNNGLPHSSISLFGWCPVATPAVTAELRRRARMERSAMLPAHPRKRNLTGLRPEMGQS